MWQKESLEIQYSIRGMRKDEKKILRRGNREEARDWEESTWQKKVGRSQSMIQRITKGIKAIQNLHSMVSSTG